MAMIKKYIDLLDKPHKRILLEHLRKFLGLLQSKHKPTDSMVRTEFIKHEAEWRLYCAQQHLGTRIADLFNAYVSLEWEQKSTQ